jgi:ceramide glucosyltransferase
MIDLLHAGAAATLAWSAAVASVSVEAIRRYAFRPAMQTEPRPPGSGRGPRAVLVVRPCAGSEPWLEANLRSITLARRSFALHYRIAIADAADAAAPAAHAAVDALKAEGIDARVVLTAARGPNRKVSQIKAAIEAFDEPFDVLLAADSDVDLGGADLDLLVSPLAEASATDAVWAPPAELGTAETLADRASAAVLGASLHAFPLLAGLDRGGLCGKLFAVKRTALAAIGGVGALALHLGEDMELARRIRARGRAIEAAPMVARSVSAGRSASQVVARFARWLMVIRAQRPALFVSYPLLFFATPLILLFAAITAAGATHLAAAAALLAVASRIAVALTAARATGRRLHVGRAIFESALADALLAAAFVCALRSRRVVWRDTVITIDRDGLAREGAREAPEAG